MFDSAILITVPMDVMTPHRHRRGVRHSHEHVKGRAAAATCVCSSKPAIEARRYMSRRADSAIHGTPPLLHFTPRLARAPRSPPPPTLSQPWPFARSVESRARLRYQQRSLIIKHNHGTYWINWALGHLISINSKN
jgi:hypothetical protein